MRCREANHQLQLYIDGRLTFERTRLLEAHLSQCAVCREELLLLEETVASLRQLSLVAEPRTLTASIMQQVALKPRDSREPAFSLLRPSLLEIFSAIALATLATLGILLQLPSVRALLPIGNGHNGLSGIFIGIIHTLMTVDSGTLTLAFWVLGTILGVTITLALAGDDIRRQWFKAVMERIPVR